MSSCWYCDLENEQAHPTCGRPGCESKTHGYGDDGKTVRNYCDGCRSGGGDE